MNANVKSKELLNTIDSLLNEFESIAQNGNVTADELYEQSVDILNLVFQPEAVSVFLLGLEGLTVNATQSGISLTDFFPQHENVFDQIQAATKPFALQDPLNRTVLAFGLRDEGEVRGVLVLRSKPGEFFKTNTIVFEAVGTILSRHAFDRLDRSALRSQSKKINKFAQSCMSTLDSKELAKVLTNDVRHVLSAERTQLFKSEAKSCRLKAVSSVASFEDKTAVLRHSKELAEAVIRHKTVILSSEKTDSEELNSLVSEYIECSGFPFFAFFPLFDSDDLNGDLRQPTWILLAEYESVPPVSNFLKVSDVVVPQMGQAMSNASMFSSIPFHKPWVYLSRKFHKNKLFKLLLIPLLLILFLAFTLIYKVDFKVRMNGTLHAECERNVFSPRDAFVKRVLVNHGDMVEEGQLLVELRSPDLQIALDEANGEIAKLKDLRSAKNVVLNQMTTGKSDSQNDGVRLAGEIAELDFQIEAQEDKRNFTLQRIEELKLHAPIAGTVVTWDLRKSLVEKPVRWGESLVKIADEQEQWQLKFLAPEKIMGHVLSSASEQPNGLESLKVEYFFSSKPELKFETRILETGKATESDEVNGHGVRLLCNIANEQELRRHGAQVVGDIHCGKRSIAFVWTRELIDSIRRQFVW